MIKCEKCKEEITMANFWAHEHNDYESIDWPKHYEETKEK